MRSFGDLIADIGRYVGRPDSVYREHIKAALNVALQGYTREFATPYTRRRRTIYATGSQQQALPQDVDRPVYFFDMTNTARIDAGAEWDRTYPYSFANATSGRVFQWDFDGVYPLIEHPSGSLLTIESSASDARSLVVNGLVVDTASSGWATEYGAGRERAFLSGTTPVTLTMAFREVHEVALSSHVENTVTIRNGTKAVAIIEPGEVAPQYVWVKWIRVPATGTAILMEYIPRAPRLRDDDQAIPTFVPADYLYWRVCKQLAADLEKDRLYQEAREELAKLVALERQKELAYGDHAAIGRPYEDAWNLDGTDQ